MNKRPAKRPRAGNGVAVAVAKWHRRLGIAAALVVAWLSVTGILLGHTDDLRLAERGIGAGWLLDWYGIDAPAVTAYPVADGWVLQAGEHVYFDGRRLRGEFGSLAGAVVFGDEVIVGAGARLLVLSRGGELLEILGEAHGVPGEVRRLGVQDDRLVVRTHAGDFSAGPGLIEWRPARPTRAAWSEPAPPPAALQERVAHDYRSGVLTLERLLLDLHSGRLFGTPGVLVMDLAALAFLVLAVSGLWLWLARRPRAAAGRRRTD